MRFNWARLRERGGVGRAAGDVRCAGEGREGGTRSFESATEALRGRRAEREAKERKRMRSA